MSETDVLILGAGPAGCAAAITARRAGLRVTLLEGRGRPMRIPGETLHPGVEPLFDRLGVREPIVSGGFRRHTGVRVAWRGAAEFQPYGAGAEGPWRGFQADRAALHSILLAEATRLGTAVVMGTPAEGVVFGAEGGRVAGVVAGGHELRARWTIDATGRRAWLSKALGLRAHIASPPLRVRFGWTSEDGGGREEEPLLASTGTGWSWRAPLEDDRIAWAELTVGSAVASGARPAGGHGADVTWRLHPACAGRGYFLVGDGAALLDPSSAHGVLRALMGGMLAAHLISRSDQAEVAAATAVAIYRRMIAENFEADAEGLRAHYLRHPSGTVARAFERSRSSSRTRIGRRPWNRAPDSVGGFDGG